MKEKSHKEFVVYRIYHVDIGKSYIGITGDYKKRMKEHFRSKDNYYLHKAIRKHSKEKFITEIVFECDSFEKAKKEEKEYISVFDTKIPNGYNMTDGGEGVLGFRFSKEDCKKMSDAEKIFSNNQILEIKQMLLNGILQKDIAKKFNVHRVTISCIKTGKHYSEIQIPKFDLLPKHCCKFTDDQIIKIKKTIESGISQKDIAKKLNVSARTIQRIKTGEVYSENKYNIDFLNVPQKHCKLTNNQVLEIRTMLSNGTYQREIGKKFNISRGTIYNIKRNRSYSDIQLPERE